MADSSAVPSPLATGQAALARGAWTEASDLFRAAARVEPDPEALEGLAAAAWWLEDVSTCLDARERAFHAYRARGEQRAAARMALWLGDDHVEFGRAPAVARGWFRRAARLLEGLPDTPERGWLDAFLAHDALARGAMDDARASASAARDIGRRHGVMGLEMFALATEGVIDVLTGAIEDGLGALDESAAAALAGEFEDLVPAAWTCCLVMSTCERVRDHDRGAQWCEQIDRFSRDMEPGFLTGVCRAHSGVLHTWRGRWDVAERELTDAVDRLTSTRPSWRAEALVRLGDLRRRQGRRTEAATLFDEVADHPLALCGRAAMCLDDGDVGGARDLLDRVLRRSVPGQIDRADALELLIRAALAEHDHDAAGAALEELRSLADASRTPALHAAVHVGDGLIAADRGDLDTACDALEDAADLHRRSGAPVEAARVRIELARILLARGRRDAAHREATLALADVQEIDGALERRQAEALLRASATREGVRGETPPMPELTPRQLEVLRLVAKGLSDRGIADRLVVSPHTVHRHMANIYTRLGCSSRPAAVAEAARHGLL